MDQATVSSLKQQLTALGQHVQIVQQALDQAQQFTFRIPPIVDPAPDATITDFKIPRLPPFADPAPFDLSNLKLVDLLRRLPDIIADPAPTDFSNLRLADLARAIPTQQVANGVNLLDILRKIPGVIVDPAPEDITSVSDLVAKIPGIVADPAPTDILHLGVVDVRDQLNRIDAEMVRLESLSTLFKERLAEIEVAG